MNRLRIIILCCAWSAVAVCIGRSDTFELEGKSAVEGSLRGYEDGWFVVEGEDGKTYRIRAERLETLTLKEPLKVDITLRGHQDSSLVWLLGYESPHLQAEKGGKKGMYRLTTVSAIKRHEELSWVETHKQEGELLSKGGTVYIPSFVSTGQVSVVHFHDRKHPYSAKLEAYLSRVQRMSMGDVKYMIVLVSQPDAPVAEQYGIEFVPQVWVYDVHGNLSEKLVSDINPRTIDDALMKAEHAGPASK